MRVSAERWLKMTLTIPKEERIRLGREWQQGMENEEFNTTTHDLGLMIMPAFRRDYELTGNKKIPSNYLSGGYIACFSMERDRSSDLLLERGCQQRI